MIKVEIQSALDEQIILEYLLKSENSLLYSNPRFVSLVATHLDATSYWILAKRNQELTGILPFLVKNGPLGPVFNSLAYYGSNGGVVQHKNDPEVKSTLLAEFYNKAERNKACSATVITNPLERDSEFYKDAVRYDFLTERIGQITNLGGLTTEEDFMKSFSDPRPRNIRRALKAGIQVESSQSKEAIDFLATTHRKNIEAIDGIPKEPDFFERIPSCMNDGEWKIFIAKLNGEPVAGLLLFYFNHTVEYFTPVIKEEHRSCQPLALLIYRAMLDAKERGMARWNWGGTWLTQGGVYDFKKRWNTKDHPYFYFTRIFNDNVMNQASSFFLKHYKGFYVLPFDKLKSNP